MIAATERRFSLDETREVLAVDGRGRPRCSDARLVVEGVRRVTTRNDPDLFDELVARGLLRDSEERYATHVAMLMVPVASARFEMGTPASERAHFCGESPRRAVDLSPFEIGAIAVTNELYALLDPERRGGVGRDRREPAVDVSWFEAALFAMWLGCRLPTEAEWEYACGAGSRWEWCCEREQELARYGWFSENAHGELHPVATREPNALGLFDCHGNVWEWCHDVFDQDFYARAPSSDPVCDGESVDRRDVIGGDRVCRGGSLHALAEMCRTRYRFHEPADFWASDLGFRLARSTHPRLAGR